MNRNITLIILFILIIFRNDINYGFYYDNNKIILYI
jgi:hypothetical protein